MSKSHLKGPLTFAKDSKNAKGSISMQIVTKIRILSEKLLHYYSTSSNFSAIINGSTSADCSNSSNCSTSNNYNIDNRNYSNISN